MIDCLNGLHPLRALTSRYPQPTKREDGALSTDSRTRSNQRATHLLPDSIRDGLCMTRKLLQNRPNMNSRQTQAHLKAEVLIP